jgi:hypothetical protein
MVCKECNERLTNNLLFDKHVINHNMTLEQYILKWKYGYHIPKCKCGCNKLCKWNKSSRDFNNFIHGHHAFGRKKSDEEKKKIGLKNSENMKNYHRDNPEYSKLSVQKLRSGLNEEVEKRRLACL